LGTRQHFQVFVNTLLGSQRLLISSDHRLLVLPRLHAIAEHHMAIAQFALGVKPLFGSGTGGGTGAGRRIFGLIARGNYLGGSTDDATGESAKTRGDLSKS
jgi:hypothetical protein